MHIIKRYYKNNADLILWSIIVNIIVSFTEDFLTYSKYFLFSNHRISLIYTYKYYLKKFLQFI